MVSIKQPQGTIWDLSSVATVAEAARVLRVDERTLRAACEAGDVPGAIRLGRSWRISGDALRRAIAGEEVPDGRLYGGSNDETNG